MGTDNLFHKRKAKSGTDNPSTRVHELVSFMQNIKQG